ncbi:MAG: phosphoribosylformylglycinamidine synthase subunit PurQ [Acidobacteria bacterium]|nr:phosphoribosylformylglycinamidine synthase subunit PurQ [Acidobacteriota bacterium]
MKFGVVIFPGSNCDHDALYALESNLGQEAVPIWHQSEDLQGCDAVVLPGGFSYGDYLRAGAIAHFSPVMKAVKRFADSDGLVIGICNGFQALTEAHLLPGALVRNANLHFVCKTVHLAAGTKDSPFTSHCPSTPLAIPVAHGEGRYHADAATLDELERADRIAFRYCDAEGKLTEAANPNGSARHIAGVLSEGRNVLGMMPHPERAADPVMGSTDGRCIFESMIGALSLAS